MERRRVLVAEQELHGAPVAIWALGQEDGGRNRCGAAFHTVSKCLDCVPRAKRRHASPGGVPVQRALWDWTERLEPNWLRMMMMMMMM